jgi:anti-sigma-K factor RskA
MQCDKEKREVTQAGLLEKYVLGLCNASEKEEIEGLIRSNPEMAEQIGQMKKAVHCYCTSCHSDKVKSIIRGKNQSSSNPNPDMNSSEAGLSHSSQGVIGKTLAYIRELLPIKL